MFGRRYRALEWLIVSQRPLDRELFAIFIDDNQKEFGRVHGEPFPRGKPEELCDKPFSLAKERAGRRVSRTTPSLRQKRHHAW